MFSKIYQPILAVAIANLLFILSISPTWAETYSDSVVLKANQRYNHIEELVLADGAIEIELDDDVVESYLEDNNLNEVEIKVELQVELVELEKKGKGKGKNDEIYYLDFTFSPPGCYFDEELEMEIDGEYEDTGYSVSLLNSAGNEIDFDGHHDEFEIYDFGDADDSYFDEWCWAASHYGSVVVEKGKGGNIKLNDEADIKIKNKSVDDYLDDMGIDSVEITVEMYYGWDGSIWFVFGPSGTFFTPKELELTIKGGYLEQDMLLVGEDGELLEYKLDKNGTKLTFYIPHFSSYYYDDYY